MKIGIDASRAFLEKRTGIEEYSHQLIKSMAKADFSFCEFILYVRKESKVDIKLADNFSVKIINNNLFWTRIGLSLELRKNPVDMLFIPSYSIPIIHPRRTIVTIHGLEFKNCPNCYSFKERMALELNTLISVLFSDKIIAPSESAKNDLIKFYKINPNKIAMVYHGAEIKNQKSRTRNQVPEKQINNRKEEFNILFIGRLEKRKNLVNLIKAFEIFMSKNEKSEKSEIRLFLAGKKGFGFKEIVDAIDKNFYKKNIILTGFVSEKEKENLFINADIFVFPSFCEGFGMPVLEAMGYGVPVVCSNIPSLMEIANKSAIFFNPKSAISIANALKSVFDDKNLRDNMTQKGFHNANRFNWEKCSEKTLQILIK